jgi:formylglycine-generating enzyme required for sulfatase activity
MAKNKRRAKKARGRNNKQESRRQEAVVKVPDREKKRRAKQTRSEYDVFISYNSLDFVDVERIVTELRDRNCSCFIDRWYLRPGRDWRVALERALAASRSVAVFISPHGTGRWQHRERSWALDRQAEHTEFPVVPVLLPNCEPPLGFMKQLSWIDLRDNPRSSTQLDALAAAIHGEDLDRHGQPEPRATICPYRGLHAFREEDSEFFFGRSDYLNGTAEMQGLLELVRKQKLVAVVGASGSGKSSLVSAGLVPELRKQKDTVWDVVRMVPHIDPLYSLAEALVPLIEPDLAGGAFEDELHNRVEKLAKKQTPLWGLANAVLRKQPGTHRLLLFVDQWEELYTNCDKATRRERFIEELLDATSRRDSPLTVVLTVRGDFYNEVLQHREFLDQSQKLDLGPMNSVELRSVIEGPAKEVKLKFQDGLAELIAKDAGKESGGLPLLEFALEELWKRRDRGELTHQGYQDLGKQTGQKNQEPGAEEAGGLSRAIATYAEGVYEKLDHDEQKALPRLLRQLVRAGAKKEDDTRKRIELSELDETTRRVARKLADERLLTISRPRAGEHATKREEAGNEKPEQETGSTVELAHEELLRRWVRLQECVDDDRDFLLWRSRIDLKLEEFERDGRAALLRGRQLQDAKRFYPKRRSDLEENPRRFLDKSLKAERFRQLMLGGALLMAVVAAISTAGVAIRNWQERETVSTRLRGELYSVHEGRVLEAVTKMQPQFDLVARGLQADAGNTSLDSEQIVRASIALAAHDSSNVDKLRVLFDDDSTDPRERFLAGLAIVKYDRESDRLTDLDVEFLSEQLVSSKNDDQAAFRESLQKLSSRLLTPLEVEFRAVDPKDGESVSRGKHAAEALADFAGDDVDRIVKLISDANSEQFRVLLPVAEKLAAKQRRTVLDQLAAIANNVNDDDGTVLQRGKRQAGAAISLIRLDVSDWDQVFAAVRLQYDDQSLTEPEALTQFIHGCRARDVKPSALLSAIEEACETREGLEPADRKCEDPVLFGLLLALGEFDYEQLDITADEKTDLTNRLRDLFSTDPSSAIHSASRWLMFHWGQSLAEKEEPYRDGREWYTIKINATPGYEAPPRDDVTAQTPFLLTFVVFPPGEYQIGDFDDPLSEDYLHTVQITRPFALLDREIMRSEFEAAGFHQPINRFPGTGYHRKVSPNADYPMVNTCWYHGVRYCRWLTEQHPGLSQAYDDPETLDQERYPPDTIGWAEGAPLFWPVDLGRTGFRLPTEAEWEIACRAGTRSPYSFGRDDGNIRAYSWVKPVNATRDTNRKASVVRSLRPNLRGLFDMHGNVREWCHDLYDEYCNDYDTVDPMGPPEQLWENVIRSGGWNLGVLPSATRTQLGGGGWSIDLGFRLAQTLPDGETAAPED